MMRKILLTTVLLIAATALSAAKMPKWVKTSRAAVCRITVYDDKGNETGSTTGFFTDADGFGLSEYNIFSNAARAVATDGNGVSREILYVSGANRIYDVVRFKVNPDKQLSFLPVAANAAGEGDILYLLPYSSDKSSLPVQLTMAKGSSMAGDYSYYTLSGTMTGDATGAPLLNADGGVVGIVQNPLDTDTCNYAVDSRFANSLSISTALTLNDDNYRGMTFRKALPDNEEQALVWLFMNQGGNQENYNKLLDGFLQQYPDNYVGYLRKGASLMQSDDSTRYAEGIAYLDKAVSVADTKDDALFEYASLVYATVTAGKSGYKGWTLDNALEKIDQAIGINELPAYVQLQGNTLYALEKYDEALKSYNKLNKTSLASPETYYYTSVIKGKLDASPDEIIATLDSAVNFYGRPYTSSVAPFILERATMKEGLERYREAVFDLNEYEQITGSSNLSAEFYYFREQIEVKARMYEQAMKDIEKAVDISPGDTGLQLEQASLLLRLGMAGDALPIMQVLAKDNPEDTDCLRLLGICLMRTGSNAQAAEYLRKASELGDDLATQLLEQL